LPVPFENKHFSAAPWDESIFGMPCFEIIEANEESLAQAAAHAGHYTVKIDPLADKSLLHLHGFYYTDTLIEPCCRQDRFINHTHPKVGIDYHASLQDLLPMCDSSFMHGRFHRDFNLDRKLADQRYKQWLTQLHAKTNVMGLTYEEELAGFIAFDNGNLLLHVIDAPFRGQGLAKHLWSVAIQSLFNQGITEVRSSISAANLAVLNLYASLGFRFDNAQDIYHKLTR